MADSSPTQRQAPITSSDPSLPDDDDADPTQVDASDLEALRTARAREPREAKATPAPPKAGPSASRTSVPPSEPRSTSRASFSQLDMSVERPARVQMIVALVLGLVLVAIPLYLWRRPRAESIAAGSGEAGVDPAREVAPAAPPDEKPTIGEPKNLQCQDPGPKKTAPEQCDHLVEVEKALAHAIEESASCVPKDAGGGSIVYVADVSFKRKSIGIGTPKDGRTMKNTKVVAACQTAVKSKLQSSVLDGIQTHAHARYRIAITATYPGAIK
ncbi:MAG: hypothetical protein KF819_06695 [Labilithrix sp.]|nr:hypothetical protein [Labilithrix sp.]